MDGTWFGSKKHTQWCVLLSHQNWMQASWCTITWWEKYISETRTYSTSLNQLSYTMMLFTIILSHGEKSTYWNMQHQSQQTVVYSDVIHYHAITWCEKYILEHAAPVSTNCRIQWCYSLSYYHMVGKVHIGTCSTSLNKLSYTVMLFTIILSHGGKSTGCFINSVTLLNCFQKFISDHI